MERVMEHFCWIKVVRVNDSVTELRQKTLEAAIAAAKIPSATQAMYRSVSTRAQLGHGAATLVPLHPTGARPRPGGPAPEPGDPSDGPPANAPDSGGGSHGAEVQVRVVASAPLPPPHPTGIVDPRQMGMTASIEVHVTSSHLPPPHPTGLLPDAVQAFAGGSQMDSSKLTPPTPHPTGLLPNAIETPAKASQTDSSQLTPGTPHPTGRAAEAILEVGSTAEADTAESAPFTPPHPRPQPNERVGVAQIAPVGDDGGVYGGSLYTSTWWQYRGSPLETDFDTSLASIIGDRAAAYRWIESEEGLEWRRDAVALKLVSLSVAGRF